MTTNVHLTPELESFARECVEAGRYRSVSEVVRAGLRLLQDQAKQKQDFMAMLSTVSVETDARGSSTLDTVLTEIDARLDQSPSRCDERDP